MDAEAFVLGVGEHVFGKYLSVSRNNDYVGIECFECFLKVFCFEVLRLINGKSHLKRCNLYGRGGECVAAIFGHIYSCYNADDISTVFFVERAKSSNGKFGRSHKKYLHQSSLSIYSSYSSSVSILSATSV